MAGTDSKKDTSSPSAEDVSSPKTDAVTPDAASLPEAQEVAAQAQPMDQQESPTTTEGTDSDDGNVYFVTLDMDNVPRAGEYEVKAGQADPSLVAIPGLGQFQNGTRTEISSTQLMLFTNHLSATGIESAALPAGVTIERKGK
jgi:hypothetical protein